VLTTGSRDFPCKQRSGVYDPEGASNVIAIDEPQALSFIGIAVHRGGSCQVSLTTDQQPTKNSKWMVIHSIEGNTFRMTPPALERPFFSTLFLKESPLGSTQSLGRGSTRSEIVSAT
jgi:hypothetical protein